MVDRDIKYGDGLTRLADSPPDEWLADTHQIMQVTTGVLSSPDYPSYGNFWANWPCFFFPHEWETLRMTETDMECPRAIRRCQRCGSQIHTVVTITPPRRGEF